MRVEKKKKLTHTHAQKKNPSKRTRCSSISKCPNDKGRKQSRRRSWAFALHSTPPAPFWPSVLARRAPAMLPPPEWCVLVARIHARGGQKKKKKKILTSTGRAVRGPSWCHQQHAQVGSMRPKLTVQAARHSALRKLSFLFFVPHAPRQTVSAAL